MGHVCYGAPGWQKKHAVCVCVLACVVVFHLLPQDKPLLANTPQYWEIVSESTLNFLISSKLKPAIELHRCCRSGDGVFVCGAPVSVADGNRTAGIVPDVTGDGHSSTAAAADATDRASVAGSAINGHLSVNSIRKRKVVRSRWWWSR